MTTISSLNAGLPVTSTSPSNTANSLASIGGAALADGNSGSGSTIVTIPSPSIESPLVYTQDGTLEGGASALTWAQSNTDAVSAVMAANYMAGSISGQFANLGSALLDRFKTTGSDFSQSVTFSSAAAAVSMGQLIPNTNGDIKLTVVTTSGTKVNIELDSEGGKLGVSVNSSGPLTDPERTALASLANGFQQAINGLGALQPTVNLSGLMQYNTSVLSSVDMQFNVGNASGDFSANGSSRSLSLKDSSGTMNLKVNPSDSAILGSGAQQNEAIASYLKQFDSANAEGHGNAEMMEDFKDAFSQLMSNDGTSSQPTDPVALSEQAMLTGLSDFTASLSESGSGTIGNPGTFDYQVSQSTDTEGDLQNGTITQTQQSHLQASYRQASSSSPGDYDDVQVDDNASSTVKLATERGILTQASLSQSHTKSTRNSEYVGGKLVSDVTTPTSTSDSKNLLTLLTPLIADGQAAQDSSAWQQMLSGIHGMILLNAGND